MRKISQAEAEWAFDKEKGLLDATGDEYKAATGYNNATEAMAAEAKAKKKRSPKRNQK